MKILVTGGTGYIGSHTVVELQQKGFDVVIVDALFNSRIQALDAIESVTGIRPEFESFDLADKAMTDDFSVVIPTSKASFISLLTRQWENQWMNR